MGASAVPRSAAGLVLPVAAWQVCWGEGPELREPLLVGRSVPAGLAEKAWRMGSKREGPQAERQHTEEGEA